MDDTDEGAFALPSVELGQPQGHADDSSSAAALVVLLEANGYSTEDAAESSRLAQITKLEMFLQDYPKVSIPSTNPLLFPDFKLDSCPHPCLCRWWRYASSAT
jgi:hypothetical protein